MLFFHFLHAPEDSYIFFAIFLCLVTIDECVFSVTDQGEGPTIADMSADNMCFNAFPKHWRRRALIFCSGGTRNPQDGFPRFTSPNLTGYLLKFNPIYEEK